MEPDEVSRQTKNLKHVMWANMNSKCLVNLSHIAATSNALLEILVRRVNKASMVFEDPEVTVEIKGHRELKVEKENRVIKENQGQLVRSIIL